MIYGSESDTFTHQTMSGVTAVPTENVYTLVSDTILNSNSNFAVTRNTATDIVFISITLSTSLDTHNTSVGTSRNVITLSTSLDTHNTSVGTSRNVIVVAVTVTGMLIVVAMIIGIPLVVLLKRKLSFKKGSRVIVNDVYQSPSSMANPVYGGMSIQLCV